MERVHPGVHQRRRARWTRTLARVAGRRRRTASTTTRCRRRSTSAARCPTASRPFGLNADRHRAQPDAEQSSVRDANNVFPFDYTSQPFQANLTDLAADLHRLRPVAPGLAGPGRRSRTPTKTCGPAGSRCGPTCTRATWRCRPRTRRSRCRRPTATAARDQLRLAQDRYRLGAGTSLEVSDAQNAVQQAEGDYVNAVYDYHKAIAALEAAVGRPLR